MTPKKKLLCGFALLVFGVVVAFVFLVRNELPTPFMFIGLVFIWPGYKLILGYNLSKAKKEWEQRKNVLLGARRMVEEERRLDLTRLAALLGMDIEIVSKHIDFAFNSGYLPADPANGFTAAKLGHVVIDLHGFRDYKLKPVLSVDGGRCAKGYGNHLLALVPGHHKLHVKMEGHFASDLGLKTASKGIYVADGDLKGYYYLGRKIRAYGDGGIINEI